MKAIVNDIKSPIRKLIAITNYTVPLVAFLILANTLPAQAISSIPKPDSLEELRSNPTRFGIIIKVERAANHTTYHCDLDKDNEVDRLYTDRHDIGEEGSIEFVIALDIAKGMEK